MVKNKKGFTLIEIIMVTVVGSILLATVANMMEFSFKNMFNIHNREGKSDINLAVFSIKKKVQFADYLEIRGSVSVGSVQNLFVSVAEDIDNPNIKTWYVFSFNRAVNEADRDLRFSKYDGSSWSDSRLLVDGIRDLQFSFPDSAFSNILRTAITHARTDDSDYTFSFYVTAMNMVKSNSDSVNNSVQNNARDAVMNKF